MANHNKQMKQAMGLVLFFVIAIGLMLSYPIFAMSSQQKVLKAVANTIKKMENDYAAVLKEAGFNQDFSKQSYHEFEIKFLSPEWSEFFSDVQALKLFHSRNADEKFYQAGLSLRVKNQDFDMVQLQFDDKKAAMILPFIFDKKLTLSSKHFGKDMGDLQQKLYGYEYTNSDMDMSFGAIDKSVKDMYDKKLFWERSQKIFETLLKDVDIIQNGDVYTCKISSENLQKSADVFFDGIPQNHEFFIAMRSDYFISRYRYQIKSMLEDVSLDLSMQISDSLVKEFKIILNKNNKKFGLLGLKINSGKAQNLFSDIVLELQDDEVDEKVSISNVLELKKGYLKDVISVFSDSSVKKDTKIELEIDRNKTKDNFRFDLKYVYKSGTKGSFHVAGNYTSDANSLQLNIPKILMKEEHYLLDKNELYGISYKATNQNVNAKAFDKAEIYLPDLSKEALEKLTQDLENRIEEFGEKQFDEQ